MAELLGPWTGAGPARAVATQALADRQWQAATRRELTEKSKRLAQLLSASGLRPDGGTALFQWVRTARAEAVQRALAERGILIRRFDVPGSVRFGLPRSGPAWEQLEQALAEINRTEGTAEC